MSTDPPPSAASVSLPAASSTPYSHFAARFLLKTFWDLADHAIFFAAANLATLGLTVTLIGAPFGLGGMLECAAVAARGREPTWDDYRRGARRHVATALVALTLVPLLVASPVVGALLYPARLGLVGYLLAGLNLWICLLVLPIVLLAIPGILLHGAAVRDALCMAAAIVFLRPLYALFGLLWLALLCAASVVAFPLMLPFITYAAFGVGLMAAWVVPMRPLLRRGGTEGGRAGACEGGAEPVLDTVQATRPRSWAEKKRLAQRAAAAEDAARLPYMARDETARTLREFFRPWES